MADKVKRPAHYTAGEIECIDAIRSALGPDGFRAYCCGNVLKYTWRYRHKGGSEDLRKAQVYLGWAIGATPEPAQVDPAKSGPPIDPPEVEPVSFEADPKLQAMIDRADEDAPLEGLTAGKAVEPEPVLSGDFHVCAQSGAVVAVE